jgi:hypothetical protein
MGRIQPFVDLKKRAENVLGSIEGLRVYEELSTSNINLSCPLLIKEGKIHFSGMTK